MGKCSLSVSHCDSLQKQNSLACSETAKLDLKLLDTQLDHCSVLSLSRPSENPVPEFLEHCSLGGEAPGLLWRIVGEVQDFQPSAMEKLYPLVGDDLHKIKLNPKDRASTPFLTIYHSWSKGCFPTFFESLQAAYFAPLCGTLWASGHLCHQIYLCI